MAFLGFLAGAALGGLAGFTIGSWVSPAWYWSSYYAPMYYTAPLPYYYQMYPAYPRSYLWHPWYGYW